MSDRRYFDLLVVGSGAAGLSAALRAAELGARVGVVTAGALLAGSSPRAQGGVAAAVGVDDAPALHAADTLAVGAGLNDAAAVDVLTREGSHTLRQMWDDGVPFEDDLGLEAGHARRRILHAGGGATGQVLTSALLARALSDTRIALVEHSPVSALVTGDAAKRPQAIRAMHADQARDASAGVVGVRAGGATFGARAVILATGGYAALWGRSTNAPETRGTGLALAWRAGAALADLEFVQFHPTALSLPGRPAFLLSEALRGEGARLIDVDGRDVVDPLLPRDVVARALHRQLRRGPVFLTLQHLDAAHVRERFADIAAKVGAFGLDLASGRLPVAPAAHYCMGGIRTDTWGRTNVPGLYAAGEVACSGVQGANRLASNSLLECLVFGARAAEAALDDGSDAHATWDVLPLRLGKGWGEDSVSPALYPSAALRATSPRLRGERILAIEARALGARLDADVGVERDASRLQRLVADLPEPDRATPPDLLLSALIARSALLRNESRGAHFRSDFPSPDPRLRGRLHWRRNHPPAFEEVFSTP